MARDEEFEMASRQSGPASITQPEASDLALAPDADQAGATSALPPVDKGRHAWLFLVGASIIETIVWGLPYSVGILHQYWTTVLFPDASSEGILTIAATLQTGMMYLSAVVYSPLFQRFPRHRAVMQSIGLLVGAVAIVASAFATRPWHLIVTIGILYPFGSAAFYMPAATLLFQWFQAKRGFASGVMYAGTGIGGTAFPFVMQALLNGIGYRAALIALGVGFGIVGGIALLPIKPRLPVARAGAASQRPRTDTAFLYRSSLYAFSAAILFTSLGNFVPSLYLPAYAVDIGLKTNDGTLLVAIMNAASVPGILVLGYLSDKAPLRLVVLLSCLGSALACLFLWGFASSIRVLVVFAIVFGFLGLSFSGVWAALITVVAKDDPHLPATVFGMFAFMRGIGNIASGPISSSLLSHNELGSHAFGSSNYGSLLLYTGLMMVVGSGVGVAYRDT